MEWGPENRARTKLPANSRGRGIVAETMTNLNSFRGAIQRRAEEIYIRGGRIPGRDIENWIQAEREILREAEEHSSRRTAVVVKVDAVRYVGEYKAELKDGYTPGEVAPGDPIWVRFEGDKMFVRRPNGRELETTIVKRVG
jgi:hypothetical protein